MRIIYSLVIICLVSQLALAQGPGTLTGQNINYNAKNKIRVRGITTEAAIPTSVSQTSQSVIYLDDLGKPLQAVSTQASPSGKDMVSVYKYDALGREDLRYLPYPSTATTGQYKSGAVSSIQSYYSSMANGGSPYSTVVFDLSPLSRVVEQGGVGDAWQPASGRTQKFSFGTNSTNEAIKWDISSDDNSIGVSITRSYYNPSMLEVSTVTDDANPQHSQSKVYKDVLGNVVIKKQQTSSASSGWAETHYIYDKLGRLRIILPPQAVEYIKTNNITTVSEFTAGYELVTENKTITSNTGISYLYLPGVSVKISPTVDFTPNFQVKPYDTKSSVVWQYAYQYMYDAQDRKIAERSPGSDWTYYVYDRADQLVLSQSGNQRSKNEWTFYKYDALGHTILTGLVTLTSSVAQLRTDVNNQTTTFESRGSVVLNYTNNAYPNVSDANAYLSANYYDDIQSVPSAYTNYIDDAFSFPNELTNQVLTEMMTSTGNKGLLCHAKKRVVGTDQWFETSYFYDKDHQNVFTSTKETGPSSAGRQYKVIRAYQDFTGLLLSERVVANIGQDFLSTLKTFEYDNAGRLLKQKCSVVKGGAQAEVIVASYVYNELGQLIDKKFHSTDNGATWLQSTDYQYNIQGGLAKLNNLMGDAGEDDYFGEELVTNGTVANAGNTARYDGLLSAMRWKHDLSNRENLYNFGYDDLSRLTTSTYKMGVSSVYNAADVDKFSENNVAYSLNGNITSLSRYQGLVTGGALNKIDQLTYNYGQGGNLLWKVTEAANGTASLGFKDGTNTDDDYAYDANGNLTFDRNKDITSITYNSLNLPAQITFKTNASIRYTYTADGSKLNQTYFDQNGQQVSSVDYLGEMIAVNGIFQTIQTSEGRIVGPSYANLLSNNEAGSTDGFVASANVSLSSVFQNNQTYVKATSSTTTAKSGLSSIGGTINVKPGERYSFKVFGYNETAQSAYLYVKGTSDIVWTGTALPQGQTNENWVSNDFVIPSGVTQITVGIAWSAPVSGSAFYVNRVALYKTDWEHQYYLTDHLGSPRVVLQTNPTTSTQTATFETENAGDEHFLYVKPNFIVPHTLANATPGGNEVIRMDSAYRIGPAKSFKVFPGDKINASVYAYYDAMSSLTKTPYDVMIAALSGTVSGGTVVDGGIHDAYINSQNGVTGFALSANQGSTRPSAFINYILFDDNYVPIKAGSSPVGSTANVRELISLPQINVDRPGILMVYLSYDNQSPNWVYFDDFKIVYQESPVIQVNSYYPYGMTSYSWIRDGETENKFLYQGKELESQTGLHDFHARQYDAALGRWLAADPAGQFMNPYLAMGNNPSVGVDPDGRVVGAFIGAFMGFWQGAEYAHQKHFGHSWKTYASILGGTVLGLVSGGVAADFAPAGILPGAAYGAATGAAFGAAQAAMYGQDIGKAALYGGITGGILGGITGGIDAYGNDANILTGESDAIHAVQLPSIAGQGKPVPYNDTDLNKFRRYQHGNHPGLIKTTIKVPKDVTLNAKGLLDGDGFTDAEAVTSPTVWGHGRLSKMVVSRAAFADDRVLFYTLGHEYYHAYHNYYQLFKNFPQGQLDGGYDALTEWAAYSYTIDAIKQNGWVPSINISGFEDFRNNIYQPAIDALPSWKALKQNFLNAPVNVIMK